MGKLKRNTRRKEGRGVGSITSVKELGSVSLCVSGSQRVVTSHTDLRFNTPLQSQLQQPKSQNNHEYKRLIKLQRKANLKLSDLISSCGGLWRYKKKKKINKSPWKQTASENPKRKNDHRMKQDK